MTPDGLACGVGVSLEQQNASSVLALTQTPCVHSHPNSVPRVRLLLLAIIQHIPILAAALDGPAQRQVQAHGQRASAVPAQLGPWTLVLACVPAALPYLPHLIYGTLSNVSISMQTGPHAQQPCPSAPTLAGPHMKPALNFIDCFESNAHSSTAHLSPEALLMTRCPALFLRHH